MVSSGTRIDSNGISASHDSTLPDTMMPAIRGPMM